MATISKSPTAKLMKKPGTTAPAAAPAAEPAAEAETKTKAPAKSIVKTTTKTAAPKPKAKEEPVATEATDSTDGGDLIASTAHEIETMKSDKAFQLVPKLLNTIDHDYFRLGGVLSVIQAQGWFHDKGHENFRSFVEAECGMQYRKSMYLIQIYNGLVESGVSWDQVKHLGWTKLKELAPILDTDNVTAWVEVAEGLTVLQLQEYIAQATKGEAADNSAEKPDSDGAKSTVTMTFKLHTDQKATVREALDKCKHETNTEHDTVALEHICLDFLGGESVLKKVPSLKELMEKSSLEEVLEIFGEVFPTVLLSAEVFDTVEEAQAAQEAQAEEAGEAGEGEQG